MPLWNENERMKSMEQEINTQGREEKKKERENRMSLQTGVYS
jgi:hypothetical protein